MCVYIYASVHRTAYCRCHLTPTCSNILKSSIPAHHLHSHILIFIFSLCPNKKLDITCSVTQNNRRMYLSHTHTHKKNPSANIMHGHRYHNQGKLYCMRVYVCYRLTVFHSPSLDVVLLGVPPPKLSHSHTHTHTHTHTRLWEK